MDFVNTYMPSVAELTQEELYDTRARLENYFQLAAPDLETNPNSVLGDLILTPQSYVIAAIEKGLDRMISDLNLENVSNGVVYNCDFVKSWLTNFGATNGDHLRPSGVIRLTFSANKQYILDRGVRFITNDQIFSIYLPNLGDFIIYRPNEQMDWNTNGTVLKDTGSGTYFADVPVLGETDIEEINAGTGFEIGGSGPELPDLVSAVALVNFDNGTRQLSIQDLAKQARTAIYSASLNTRNGAIRYVNIMCPFVDGVYAVHNGDPEMVRDYNQSTGISMGYLDLYVRSTSYNFTETQVLKLKLNADESAYEGEFPYIGQPYHIESVTHANVDQENLEYTMTSTNDVGLGPVAAYTIYEKLSISIPESLDENGDSRFTPEIEDDGNRYAYFTIVYQTDPMLQAIAQTVGNADYSPVNTSVLVRGFIPVVIDQMEVCYVRDPGVVPDLEQAFTDIKAYVSNVGAPDILSEAEIVHIMQHAGVKYTKQINVRAHVQWSLGQKIMGFDGKIVDSPKYPKIDSITALRNVYPPAQANASEFACSPRTIRYWFMEKSLTFKEILDI